jgi:hypothetical protein
MRSSPFNERGKGEKGLIYFNAPSLYLIPLPSRPRSCAARWNLPRLFFGLAVSGAMILHAAKREPLKEEKGWQFQC